MTLIEINDIPPSLNRFIGRNNVHAYRKAKREWDDLVYLFAIQKRPREPYKRAEVHIKFIFPDRRKHDVGNMEKFITDGLIKAGIIEDDNYMCIGELHLSGGYEAGVRKTIVGVAEK